MINLMIRFLPFILVPVLIIAGLGFWRFTVSTQNTDSLPEASSTVQDAGPVEVPKILPQATVEDRVKSLEDTMAKIVPQVNSLKPSGTLTSSTGALDSRITSLESAVTDLKTRIAALEKTAPAPATSSQSIIYIPIGSTSGPWTNSNWELLNEYEISLNPDNYPGYSNMNLEVNYRMVDPTGTGSIRLYNVTDASVVSSQLDTSATSFKLYTTNTFKLASGQKTYKLQIKSTNDRQIYIQSARIKVNF